MERLRLKKKTKSSVIGVTWYTAEDWKQVKATATDPERFEATYAGWQLMAVEALANLKRACRKSAPHLGLLALK